tara:strand:+ start:198 stop:527 length:330 start_codon:yes stop_codon:yes gene_type:complete
MAFENRRWLVIPIDKIGDVNFDQVLEPNAQSLRKSVNNEKTFIKYEVRVVEETYTEAYVDVETGEEHTNTINAGTYGRPSIYSEEYTEYNHAGMLELLETEEWTNSVSH